MGKASRSPQKCKQEAKTASVVEPAGRETSTGWKESRPILRFAGTFLALLVVFQIVYYQWIVGSRPFEAYLDGSARLASAILRVFGTSVVASGGVLSGSFSMSIRVGCDGLQAMAILLCAVLAFPGSRLRKAVGVLAGIAVLLVLNLLRIVTLYLAGVSLPEYFQMLHVHAWPAVLILAALVLWITWAMWVTPRARPAQP